MPVRKNEILLQSKFVNNLNVAFVGFRNMKQTLIIKIFFFVYKNEGSI